MLDRQIPAEVIVAQIVATSLANNAVQGVTGALLFTGTHFNQVLEGDRGNVEVLLKAIGRDGRHDRVVIASRIEIEKRQFGKWSLSYSRPSQFMSPHFTKLLSASSNTEHRLAAAWLTDPIHEFSLD